MIEVMHPGMMTTVQDQGRSGYRCWGIPLGGAMDPVALQLANWLVGNDGALAGLEMTLRGPRLRFTVDTLIALTGADLEAMLDGLPLSNGRAIGVKAGQVLSFGRCRRGCRGYLAVAGGITVPLVWDSRSTDVRAHLGGFAGRALQAGDQVPIDAIADSIRERWKRACPRCDGSGGLTWYVTESAPATKTTGTIVTVRALRGRWFSRLTPAAQGRCWEQAWQITAAADRMGYRLQGEALAWREPVEMISEGVAVGAMQVPPDGQPIVLLADSQTTGGYPVVANVATIDRSKLAQCKPGDVVQLQEVTLEEAQAAYRQQAQKLALLKQAIGWRWANERR
ncbi:biotin-dependent carboxyltransferase family protein [Heliophilum fasciatum]|uniref:Antagonist of KipI n=1 Tax=Heliophilum fasciatum TaxID=35700 RepID=A0A4R2RPL4_9FIRM|nr:biotin-dependent carboxyltransferase family protein [Heliophilum fasciatum]MCW2277536.1 antagonist of KipI [Heliophilum fasciatum]TCP65173.1 antagonist of KipI [Heliophilum fasciatum]